MKQKKIKKIVSCQAFSPIKDIRDGIIVTKKGNFVKLMEFAPINFSLRSASERNLIISQYQAAIRTFPRTVQFKVVSRRADVGRYLTGIMSDMERETNPGAKELMVEQMKMIGDIGAHQGVTRRFFLAFPYENEGGLTRSPSFREIRSTIDRQAEGIRQTMALCGNEMISKENDDQYILEALYTIMSRSQSEELPFEQRQADVVARYAGADNIDFLAHPNIQLPVNDFIAPEYIDTESSSKYIVIDGTYYLFCYLPSDAYPVRAIAGWMQLFVGMGEGIDVDLWLHKEDPGRTQTKLQYKLRWNKIKMKQTDDTSQDFDDLQSAIDSGFYLKQGLSSGDEFAYMATMLTITGKSVKEIEYKYSEVKRICAQSDMKVKQCIFQQEAAFQSSVPICEYNANIFRKSRRNILTSDFGSTYLFVSSELNDEGGILMGVDSQYKSQVFVNVFDSRKYPNANVAILGSSGAGKTYTLETMALRMRQNQTQVFIIAPLKGWEFERACNQVGGSYVKIAPGSGQNINIMEIRRRSTSANQKIDGSSGGSGSILMAKIQQLHIFFSLLVQDISVEERQYLDEALMKTYARFGITNKNKSLLDPADHTKYRRMPILSDLHDELKRCGPGAKRLYQILTRYVSGSASSFNSQTNVDLTEKYIVLDVSTLSREMLPLGMFIALDYVWDKIQEDITARKTVFIDEAWRLIGPGASKQAADFVVEIFKTIRGMGGSAVAATQDLNDFFALDNGSYGTAIISNSKIKLLMKCEPKEAAAIAESMELTKAEVDKIQTMKRGTCLLVANQNHIFIDVKATRLEHDLITTDREDLQRIARKNAEARVFQ